MFELDPSSTDVLQEKVFDIPKDIFQLPFRKSVLRYILEGQGVDQALDAPVERIER